MSERRGVLPARQAKIEYLRARAAYEREALSFHAKQLGRELSPKRWVGRLLQSKRNIEPGVHSGFVHLVGQSISFASRYPYLVASLSSLFVGKRWRWMKWIGIGIAVWQSTLTVTPYQNQNESDDPAEQD